MAQDIGRLEGIAEYNRITILVEIGNEICTDCLLYTSMLEKLTFIQMYLKHPDYRSIFIDPDGEYTHLLEEMGGVQINITPVSYTHLQVR